MNNTSRTRLPVRRLWGRAKGRPLSPHQQSLVDNLLPKVAVDLRGDDILSPLSKLEGITLEVGFGGAEHLLDRAAKFPDHGFIGVEPFLNGVAKALAGIDQDNLSNIRLHHGDARDVLDRLPDHSVANVHILYPDPWPKTRHHKRRLIRTPFIAEIHRVIRPGGEFRFASDIPSYVDWGLERILRHGGFEWAAQRADDWMSPYPGWPSTRYEQKALREGRTPHYLSFIVR